MQPFSFSSKNSKGKFNVLRHEKLRVWKECHETIQGYKFHNGFKANGAVDVTSLKTNVFRYLLDYKSQNNKISARHTETLKMYN